MAGPGAITATVLLAGQASRSPWELAVLIGVIASVLIVCILVFLFASRLAQLMGATVSGVLSRMFGVLLAALAVQYVVDGIRLIAAG
jgi:multiple antibiotic resistance protein